MSLPVWITPSGFLGTITERTSASIALSVVDTATFSLISGILPVGLNLNNQGIISGIPASVGGTVTTQFVIRASDPTNSSLLTDRTFTIDTQGLSNLAWVTPAGYLNVGFGKEYYVINKENVDYQFIANPGQLYSYLSTATDAQVNTLYLSSLDNVDMGQPGAYRRVGGYGIQTGTTITNISYTINPVFNGYAIGISLPTNAALTATSQIILYDSLPANRQIKYFIADGDGDLPPGLTLDSSGHLIGLVKDNLGLNYQVSLSGGYDSEKYDGYPYDHATLHNGQYTSQVTYYIPKTYQFSVTASDGLNSVKQSFLIRVVDPSNLTADITSSDASGPYAAESSSLVPPLWLSPVNLGTIRAVTTEIIQLKNYDPYPNTGIKTYNATAKYRWAPDTKYINGEWVIYYPGNYYFLGDWNADLNYPPLSNSQTTILANSQYLVSVAGLQNLGNGSIYYEIGDLIIYDGMSWNRIPNYENSYICNTDHMSSNTFDTAYWTQNQLPSYFSLDKKSGALYGKLPYIPVYTEVVNFYIRIDKQDIFHNNVVYANRHFNLTIKGLIDNTIYFVTKPDLGSLNIGYLSEMLIQAAHSNSPINVSYQIIGGRLPPGLSLKLDGSIVGRITYGTTIGEYNFTVRATDIYKQTVEQNFFINVTQYDNAEYTQIFVTPFLSLDKRDEYKSFINDLSIFNRDYIYRVDDPDFGIQQDLKLYLEHGIEKANTSDYFAPMVEFFKNKNLIFGDVQVKQAKDLNGNYFYDVVYLDIRETELNSFGQPVDVKSNTAYPSSIANMRTLLETVISNSGNITVKTDQYQLPSWMRTYQSSTGNILDYVPAVVLCYCKPNTGDIIRKQIKDSNFNFNTINFEIDRLIVESTLDNNNRQYLIFPTIMKDGNGNLIDPQASYLYGAGIMLTENGQILTIN
jgi:hypothetical protein